MYPLITYSRKCNVLAVFGFEFENDKPGGVLGGVKPEEQPDSH
jgi:hypothetical protein